MSPVPRDPHHLPVDIDAQIDPRVGTARAGVSLIELMRTLGVTEGCGPRSWSKRWWHCGPRVATTVKTWCTSARTPHAGCTAGIRVARAHHDARLLGDVLREGAPAVADPEICRTPGPSGPDAGVQHRR